MTSREKFFKFFEENHTKRFVPGVDGSIWEVWQAAERDMLERCVAEIKKHVSHPDCPDNSVWSSAYDHVANEIADALKELLND